MSEIINKAIAVNSKFITGCNIHAFDNKRAILKGLDELNEMTEHKYDSRLKDEMWEFYKWLDKEKNRYLYQ